MARNDKFILKLKGKIDLTSASINNIKNDIKQVEDRIGKIQLKVELDEKSLSKITRQLKDLQKLGLNNVQGKKVQTNANSKSGTNKEAQQMQQSVQKTGEALDKVRTKYNGLEEDAKQVKQYIMEYTDELGRQVKMVERINVETGERISSEMTVTENYKKQRQEAERVAKSEEKKKKKLQEQLEIFKKQSAEQIKGMKDRNAKYMSKSELANLNRLQREISNLTVATPKLNQEIRRLKSSLSETNKTFIASQKGAIGFGKAMKTALEKFSIWIGASTLFFQTFRFFTNGVKYVLEMNKALTEISVVTGQTQKEVNELGLTYQKMARNMGVLTSEITAGSVEFYRQGLTTIEVMERMETTIKASKIAGVEFTQMAETLTATVNSMGVDIDRASDVFAYLGDATATSYEEIATGFQKVGGTAGALGVEFEKVSSWIAVVSSRTRESAKTIGTSFNTILSRMSGLMETGFNEEDNTRINDVAKALNSIQIELTNADGTFRDFGIVLDEVGGKWDSLSSREKSYIATTIAGVRQQSRFLNLMEGYSESVDLYNKSLESAGTTQEKYNLWLEGTEAKLNKLRTTATGVWQNAFDTQLIKDVIGLLTVLVSGFDKFVSVAGLLPAIFAAIVPVVLLFNKSLRGAFLTQNLFIGSLGKFKSVITNYNMLRQVNANLGVTMTRTQMLSASMNVAGVSVNLLRLKLIALNTVLTMGVGFAIQLIFTGLMKLHNIQERVLEKTRELRQEFQQSNSAFSNNIKELKGLANEYKNLSQKISLTAEEEKRYAELRNKIAEISPEVVKGYDEEGNAILDKKLKVEDLIEALKEQQRVEREGFINSSGQDYDKYLQEMKKKKKDIASIENQIDKLKNGGTNWETNASGNVATQVEFRGIKQLREEMAQLRAEGKDTTEISKTIKEYENKIVSLQGQIKTVGSDEGEFTQTMKERFKALVMNSEGYSEVLSELKIDAFELAETVRKDGIKSLGEADQKVKDHIKQLAQLSNAYNDVEVKAEYDKLVEQFLSVKEGTDEARMSSEQFDKKLEELFEKYKLLDGLDEEGKGILYKLFKDSDGIIENLADVDTLTQKLGESTDSLVGELTELEEIQDKVAEGHSFGYDEIEKLRKKYPELEKSIKRTADGWKIEKGAVDKLRTSIINQEKTQRLAEINNTKIKLEETKNRLKSITKEIEGVKSLADAYKVASQLGKDMGISLAEQSIMGTVGRTNSYEEYLKAMGVSDPLQMGNTLDMLDGKYQPRKDVLSREQYDTFKENQRELIAYGQQVDELDRLTEEVQSKIDEITSGGLSGGSSKKSDKAVYDSLLPYLNALEELETKLKQIQALKDMTTDDAKRIEYMKQETEILDDQQDALHNLANEYRRIRNNQKAQLEKAGFLFEGTGDSMMIKNLSNIEGKSKEVKKVFDEFLNLQTKKIPELGIEWWQLEKAIEDIKNAIMDIELDQLLESSETRLEQVNGLMDSLAYRMNLLGDNQSSEKIDLLKQRVRLNEKIIKLADTEIVQLREKIKLYANNKEKVEELNNRILELSNTQRDANLQLMEDIREQETMMFSAIQNIESKIIDMLRQRNEEERKAFEDNHKEELKVYDEKLKAYKDYINGRIKALDDAYDERSYQKELADKQEELKQMQLEMNKLALDDSLSARQRLNELTKQYADKEEEIEETKLEHKNDALKDNLKQSLNDYEDNIESQKDLVTDRYDHEKEKMEQRHSDAKLYAEARKMLVQGNFEEIQEMLLEHEDKWGQGLSVIGDSIKTNIVDQLLLIQQLMSSGMFDNIASGKGLINPITGNTTSSGNAFENPLGMSYADLSEYVSNKIMGQSLYDSTGDWGVVNDSEYHKRNEKLRKKYGIKDEHTIAELQSYLKGYDKGGVIDYTGLAMVHGSKTNSEVAFNSTDAKKLYDIVRNLPSISHLSNKALSGITNNNISLSIANLVNIEGNADEKVVPKIRQASEDAVTKIVKDLKKRGWNGKVK